MNEKLTECMVILTNCAFLTNIFVPFVIICLSLNQSLLFLFVNLFES